MTREEEEKWDGDENNHSQVKAQINDMSYLNDLPQSSESASQDGDVFKYSTLQVEPLGLRYKGRTMV